MARDVQDHFFREAKRQGYLSRAAFKLIEIDDRKRVLRKGAAVLDCGAAPGSWTQISLKRIGRAGRVVAIDLQPIRAQGDDRLKSLQGDFTTMSPEELLECIAGGSNGKTTATRMFDVVLSDMAPSTTGDRLIDHYGSIRLCEAVLDRAADVLRPGGKLVIKAFEGEAYPGLLQRCKTVFKTVKGFRPKASRNESTEMFIVAEDFAPGAGETG